MPTLASPRQRFLKDERAATEHAALMAGAGFRHASETALLQVVHDLADTADPVQAAAAYHRVVGAREYLRKLRTLGDPEPEPAPIVGARSSGLNFNT